MGGCRGIETSLSRAHGRALLKEEIVLQANPSQRIYMGGSEQFY